MRSVSALAPKSWSTVGHGPLIANALMHLVNDGCFVAMYPLLPFIAREYHLSYAEVGTLRTALSTFSTVWQVPMALLAERFGDITMLAFGTAWVSVGFMLMGLAGSFLAVLLLTCLAGSGGSTQHPIATSYIAREYEGPHRASALGILNFAGDLGKFVVPALFALTLPYYGWRQHLFALGAVALLFSGAFWLILQPREQAVRRARQAQTAPDTSGWGIRHPRTFASLVGIGVLDAGVRNTLLTFVPFLLLEKGFAESSASVMLTVIFAGGALGKLGCGVLTDRLGATTMIILTEACTAAGVFTLLLAPSGVLLPLLFILGVVLNGTSSVLLDGVADSFESSKRSRGYGLYFTIYLGAGAIGPIVYGWLGDAWGLHNIFIAMAVASLAIVPLGGLYYCSVRAQTVAQ